MPMNYKIHCVLNKQDYERIKRYCNSHNLSTSAFLRHSALTFLDFKKQMYKQIQKELRGRPKNV
jgi:hypothetical protein